MTRPWAWEKVVRFCGAIVERTASTLHSLESYSYSWWRLRPTRLICTLARLALPTFLLPIISIELKSWSIKLASMAAPALDQLPFTISNIPYGDLIRYQWSHTPTANKSVNPGVISTQSDKTPRCATAIGDSALDLAKYAENGNLSSLELGHNFSFAKIFAEVHLNQWRVQSLNWL